MKHDPQRHTYFDISAAASRMGDPNFAAASPRPTPSEEPTKGGELSRGIAEPQPLATVADPAGVSEKAVWTRKPGVRDDVLKMAEEPVYLKANIAEVQL